MERAICQSTPNIVQHTTRVRERERAGDYGSNRRGEGVYCDDIVQINLLSKAAWMTTLGFIIFGLKINIRSIVIV